MGIPVTLSTRSLALLDEYARLLDDDAHPFAPLSSNIDSERLVECLYGVIRSPRQARQRSKQEQELLLASLRAQLLQDLFLAMAGDALLIESLSASEMNEANRWTYLFLSIAGTLFAACEGFDSIATILGVVCASSAIILPVALAFSILSVIAFHAFELVQVAKNLGVNVSDASKLLNEYCLQMKHIKGIRQKIDSYCLATLSADELSHLDDTLHMLQKRFDALKEAGTQFHLALNGRGVRATKIICSAVTGIFFFGGGFCAGQTVGTFFCGLLFVGVSPAFWPVVLISLLTGLAALSLYYYVERVTVSRLISGWFGLDEDKIEILCDAKELEKEEKRILNLEAKVRSTQGLVRQLASYSEVEEETALEVAPQAPASGDEALQLSIRVSSNRQSFYHTPALPRLEVEQESFEPALP